MNEEKVHMTGEKIIKITGYKLQQTIKELSHTRDVLKGQADASVFQFATDLKVDVENLVTQYAETEEKIARLQNLQAEYNKRVTVEIKGNPITLCEAVKRLGGATRIEKFWRTAAIQGTKENPYSGGTRDRNQDYKSRAIPVDKCVAKAREAAQYTGALKEAIQVGNSNRYPLLDFGGPDLYSLFE